MKKNIPYKFSLKSLLKIFLVLFFTGFAIDINAQTNSGETISRIDYGPGGIFEKFKPEDEIISKRDRTSKHFKNPDGSITAILNAGTSLNYKENGIWKTINKEIKPNDTGKNPDYAYTNVQNFFKNYYPKKSGSQGIKIDFVEGAIQDWINPRMCWFGQEGIISSIQPNVVDGNVDNNKITYPSVFTATDVRFTQGSDGRKMDIIINDISAISEMPEGAIGLAYSEEIILPEGWTAKTGKGMSIETSMDDIQTIIVFDDKGKEILRYIQPIAYEEKPLITNTDVPLMQNEPQRSYSKEDKPENNKDNYDKIRDNNKMPINNISYKIEKDGNTLTFWTVVPTLWLLAPERNFPIIVDPSYYCSGTNYTGYVWWWDGSTNRGTYFVGYYDGWLEAYAEVNITTIPDGSDVTAVTFYHYQYNAWNSSTWLPPTYYLKHMANRGSTQSGAALSGDINDGSNYISLYSMPWAIQWISNSLNSTGVADFEGRLTDNWFAVGICPWNANNVNYAGYDGYSDANIPYFAVTYIDPCTTPSNPSASGTATICSGASTNISATSTNATTIYWYTGGCGTTFQGTSAPGGNFSVSPASTTTYYARGYNSAGGGCWSAGCGSVTITIESTAPTYGGYSNISGYAYMESATVYWVKGGNDFKIDISHSDNCRVWRQYFGFNQDDCNPNGCGGAPNEIKSYNTDNSFSDWAGFVDDTYIDINAASCVDGDASCTDNDLVRRWNSNIKATCPDNDYKLHTFLYDILVIGVGYTDLGVWVKVDNTAPTHDAVSVSDNCWITDNAHDYTITVKSTEPRSGFGGSYGIMALVNYDLGAALAGGYFAWHPTAYTHTDNQMAATGGGFASKAATWGGDKITLISCNTSLSGNQRTVNFVVRPQTDFIASTDNDISMYTSDKCSNNSGWTTWETNFSSWNSNPGSITGVPASVCSGSTVTLTLAGYTGSIQWQSSPAGCGSWTDIGGATSTPYVTAALTSTTCFRAKVTYGVCASAYSTTVIVTVNTLSTPATSIQVTY